MTSFAVSATECAVSAAIAAEPDTTAATPLATAMPALAASATRTVPTLSGLVVLLLGHGANATPG